MSALAGQLNAALSGRYRIERELGRGGMATVYLGDDLKHHRPVAIKVLDPTLAAVVGDERFLREIEVAARLSHPHIVPLFDSGAADRQLYFVMPYIEGETLRARLDREKQLPLDDAVRLTREIASALGHAHRHGLVHRDIKPENVLISDGLALVADFGIARPMPGSGAPGLTQSGIAVGTPAYMAPEQTIGSGHVDGRADLYALGCVLYEMLAGQPPFTGSPETLLYQHLSAQPAPITDLRPGVPGGVAAAIAKVLSKSPDGRYATAARFAEALSLAGAGVATLESRTRRAGTAIPNNLPTQRTRFIGREKELAECARLLGDTRLLTLTGMGGCGKTRLALQVAEHLLETFADGVWFVDLAPLQDAERVALTVATALAVRETQGVPLLEKLARRLAGQSALIVLDNCEHVIGAVARLADALLAVRGRLTLLATSREGLGIAGERVLALRPLSVPARLAGSDPKTIEASEAGRLFVDRAQRVDARFELNARTAVSVAEICRRLDGIPLAIELAAARVRLLSVAEIGARLEDRFQLLTGGSKTALPRHQTLRAMLQWSYDQLTAEEQRLFRGASVFAGGWTLEAAARVAWAELDEFELLELLGRLVDKSLVETERVGDGSTRYMMLETVRQYAKERLSESREGDGLRGRHLGFYLALAEEAVPQLAGPHQGAWLDRLEREQENWLAAQAWCDRSEDGAEKGLRLVGALWRYWTTRGLLKLGLQVTEAALGRSGAEAKTSARAVALRVAGVLAHRQGLHARARGYAEESLAVSHALGDREGMAGPLRLLGIVVAAQGDRAGARTHLEGALALARELRQPQRVGFALNSLVELDRLEGDLDRAASRYEEELTLLRESGDVVGVVVPLLNLAMVAIDRGEHDAARGRLGEATRLAEETRSKDREQLALDVTAALASAEGDYALATAMWGTSEVLREAMGLERDNADAQFMMPWMARARRALGDHAFEVAEAEGRSRSFDEALVMARAWLEGQSRALESGGAWRGGASPPEARSPTR